MCVCVCVCVCVTANSRFAVSTLLLPMCTETMAVTEMFKYRGTVFG